MEEIQEATLVGDENETPNEDYSQQDQSSEKTDTTEQKPEFEKKRFNEIVEGKQKEVVMYKELALEAAVKAAKVDANSLLDLHKKNPELAKEAAIQFDFGATEWGSFDNFLEQKKPNQKKMYSEEEIEEITKSRISKNEHERAITKAHKLIDELPTDVKEKAKAYFDKISDSKTLNEDDALEYADMAILYVNKDRLKGDKATNAMADAASASVSRSKKSTDDEMVSIIRGGKVILVPKNS